MKNIKKLYLNIYNYYFIYKETNRIIDYFIIHMWWKKIMRFFGRSILIVEGSNQYMFYLLLYIYIYYFKNHIRLVGLIVGRWLFLFDPPLWAIETKVWTDESIELNGSLHVFGFFFPWERNSEMAEWDDCWLTISSDAWVTLASKVVVG